MGAEPLVATYSIAACDLEAGEWGVATQSKFLAVGSVVPWAEPHVGAIATQAYANPRYGPEGLDLLRVGRSAEEVVAALTKSDADREHRQLGVVDGEGRGATFTGQECNVWAGGRVGDGYAAQGNILVSGDTVDAIATMFEASADGRLAERLIECLAAGQSAGGDSRGQQSAALLVVAKDAELRERLARLGYEGELAEALFHWGGRENLEERIDGAGSIDPVVLEELRRQS